MMKVMENSKKWTCWHDENAEAEGMVKYENDENAENYVHDDNGDNDEYAEDAEHDDKDN